MIDKSKLTKLFEYKFDRIFCIHLVNYRDRMQVIQKELDRVGILGCKNFEFYYDVLTPFDSKLFACFHDINPNVAVGIKKLTINHYNVIKRSVMLGYERILIMEDDMRFLKNINDIYDMLNAMPEDMDLCMFDKNITPDMARESKKYTYTDFYIGDYYRLFSAGLYALSAKGMEAVIDGYESMYKGDVNTNIPMWAEKNTEYPKGYHINFTAADMYIGSKITYSYIPVVQGYTYQNMAIQASLLNAVDSNFYSSHLYDLSRYMQYDEDRYFISANNNENLNIQA